MRVGAVLAAAVATGGEFVSANGVILLMTVAFLLYSFFGGLVAAAYTDFVQGLLIIAAVALALDRSRLDVVK